MDVAWSEVGLRVEIDGGHHGFALNPVDDAFRQDEVRMGAERVLRVLLVGLGLVPDALLDQVVRARHLL